jgi:hypothetical protein
MDGAEATKTSASLKGGMRGADTGPVTLTPSPDGRRGWSRILVIDDDPDIGFLVWLVLRQQGYDVVLTDDGLRGLAAAQNNGPMRSSST